MGGLTICIGTAHFYQLPPVMGACIGKEKLPLTFLQMSHIVGAISGVRVDWV